MSYLICICNAVRDSDIDEAIDQGISDFAALQTALDVSMTCGGCRPEAEVYFREALIRSGRTDGAELKR